MAKTEMVRLRISPELKEQLWQAAEKENRSISNYSARKILDNSRAVMLS